MEGRILVVDDEPAIVELVGFNLVRAGYQVSTAFSGPEGLEKARTESPDLVVLDLMLPGVDGLEVCRELRRWSRVPVLMLTAKKEEVDRIVGLELGADDYMTKPFSPRELVARVKAILRRAHHRETRTEARFGGLAINYEAFRVTLDGEPVELTPSEFRILRVLTSRPGRVYTRTELLDLAKGEDFFGDLRTVDVHIRHLRAKLGDNPDQPRFIETVRGVGYRFRYPQP